jgi:hypothetical protein
MLRRCVFDVRVASETTKKRRGECREMARSRKGPTPITSRTPVNRSRGARAASASLLTPQKTTGTPGSRSGALSSRNFSVGSSAAMITAVFSAE